MEKGIKETKEMLLGVFAIVEALGPILKDGFQAGKDLPAMFVEFQSNDELRSKITAAVEKANEVPLEMKDLSLKETIELLTAILPEVTKVIDAWSKIELKKAEPVA
jgi:hypothetical protein